MNVKGNELRKIVPMSLMLMFITFVNGIVSPMRDTLMVKVATCGGADTTIILKSLTGAPASLLLMAVFIRLSKKYSTPKVLTMVVLFFCSFFSLFGLVLFPMRDHLQMSQETIRYWQSIFPYAHWIIVCIGNWLFSLFYIFSALWTISSLPLTFWHIANTYTTKDEAKKFFGYLNLLGPIGGVSAGMLSHHLGTKWSNINDYGLCVVWQLVAVVIAQVLLIITCNVLFKTVIKDDSPMSSSMKSNKKMGVWSSIKYVVTNKVALCIALFSASYYIVMNPIEAAWKNQIRAASSSASEFNAINGWTMAVTSLVIIFCSLTMTVTLSKFKWQTNALITPVFLGVVGVLFMLISNHVNFYGADIVVCGKSLINWAVIVGTIAICIGKGSKKSVFDTTKNMAYRVLEPENRLKARLATETCGSRVGEVIGNTIPAMLTNVIFPGASIISKQVLPCIIVFVCIGLVLWICVIRQIQKHTVE